MYKINAGEVQMLDRQEILQRGHAVSVEDGRYKGATEAMSDITSEFGLMKYRAKVEVEWLKTLGSGVLPNGPTFSTDAVAYLDSISEGFGDDDYVVIKDFESTTNHDVKAVEYWLRGRISEHEELAAHEELVHFGCTSEDINNLAYGLMLTDLRSTVINPLIDSIGQDLEEKAHTYADLPMLGMTHGQPATPTTVGKEYAVYVDRISGTVKQLGAVSIMGKFSGAIGNFAAHKVAYKDLDWRQIGQTFVEALGLVYNPRTTQIEPHDYMAEYFDVIARLNNELRDLAQDNWLYVHRGVLKQAPKPGEVGSSAMPHKVNPIDFENARGNFKMANAILSVLSEELPVSMMQRDLSDSTMQRNIGPAIARCVIGYKSLLRGLGKVAPNEIKLREELDSNWQVLGEAVQTVLRSRGVKDAYEIIKEATRGKDFDNATYIEMIEGLDIDAETKEILAKLNPSIYVGDSAEIAKTVKYSRE